MIQSYGSPTLATQEVHLSHAGGQHQQFSTTNHYVDIKKNANSLSTYYLLNGVNCFYIVHQIQDGPQ